MSKKQKLPRGIRPRGDKWFVDVTVDGVRRTATRDTYENALRAKAELTEALRNGIEVSAQRHNARCWTLQEALDKTLNLEPKAGWRGTSWAPIAKMATCV